MKNNKILVTGASRGIGQAIAIRLARSGYSLVLHARKAENLENTIQMLPTSTPYNILIADFSEPEAVKEFIRTLKKTHKDLFGIISNAGIALDKPIAYQPEKDIDLMLQINLRTPVLLGKYAMKHFIKTKKGVFINIASCIGEMGNAFQSVYAATKAGLVALSKSWAKEIGQLAPEHQVRFLSVSPGFVETDMTRGLNAEIQSKYLESIPANRFGNTAEVANLIAFLMSEDSPYINGSDIKINGGIL
ncbi:MAG: SDR family NAD(P)-dependent oxidoreductase [Bacteroidota bacterium]